MSMLRRHWPWIVAFIVLLALPFLFYDWSKGRHSGFALILLSEIGVMAIFALSYNMLMGQAGLLSFGHAVLFGLGAYCAAHVVNMVKAGTIWLPTELVPLAGGLGAAGAVVLFLYGVIPTYQAAHFGRVYAAYGGVFVVLSLLWGWLVGGIAPDGYDLAGGAVCLLGVAVIIVVEGALSFLGLGVPPPISSWGSMIGEGRESLDIAPRLAFLPAAAMFLTVLSFNLVGDTLRALTDPRQGAL